VARLRALPAHSALAASWNPVARLTQGRFHPAASKNNRKITFFCIIQCSGREWKPSFLGVAARNPELPLSIACSPGPVYAKDEHPRFRTSVAQRGYLQCTKGEGERLVSVRIVCRKRMQLRDREGPLEPQATLWHGTEGQSSLRLYKELLPCQRPCFEADGAEYAGEITYEYEYEYGKRYSPLLLREQGVENKISPDCELTQGPKIETNRTKRKSLYLFLGTQHTPLCTCLSARDDARCPPRSHIYRERACSSSSRKKKSKALV